MPNDIRGRDQERRQGRTAESPQIWNLAKLLHQHIVDRECKELSPYVAAFQHLQRACGLWIALRRTHLELTNERLFEETGFTRDALLLIEAGLADRTLGTPQAWYRLCKALTGKGDIEQVAVILDIARGDFYEPPPDVLELLDVDLSPRGRLGPQHALVFDTTLRDGADVPGYKMNMADREAIARKLVELGVDIIEAGFPAQSTYDQDVVERIAHVAGTPDGPIIAAVASAKKQDIDLAWIALQPATHRRLNIFQSTSDIHLRLQLKKTPEEALERARAMVAYASSLGADVQFSAMDATRSRQDYLYKVLEAVIEAGATTITIPDTIGYTVPEEYHALISDILHNVRGANRVILATHCHNDLGLAVANSLAGVRAGARQIECTLNGISDRAGNTPFEELVTALDTRSAFYNIQTGINKREIYNSCLLVSQLTGVPIPLSKSVTGDNAFLHKTGIHRDGAQIDPETFEAYRPEQVGRAVPVNQLHRYTRYRDFRTYLETRGYWLKDQRLIRTFADFKRLTNRQPTITDEDIVQLVAGKFPSHIPIFYRLRRAQVLCGAGVHAEATVWIECEGGQLKDDHAMGVGPIDAVSKAIDKIVHLPNKLIEIAVHAMTEGVEASAEVTVYIREIREEGSSRSAVDDEFPESYCGYAAHVDTVVATAEAYIDALNQMLAVQKQREKAQFHSRSRNRTLYRQLLDTSL